MHKTNNRQGSSEALGPSMPLPPRFSSGGGAFWRPEAGSPDTASEATLGLADRLLSLRHSGHVLERSAFNLTRPGGRGGHKAGVPELHACLGLEQRQPESAGRTQRLTRPGSRPLQPPQEPRASQAGVPHGRRIKRPDLGEEVDRETRLRLLPWRRRFVFRRRNPHAARGGAGSGGFDFGAYTTPRAEQRGGGEERPALAPAARSDPWRRRRAAGRVWAGPSLGAGPAWSRPSALQRLADRLSQLLPFSVLGAECNPTFFSEEVLSPRL